MTFTKGLDMYEGTPDVNFAELHKTGDRFIIHKATEGATYRDSKFEHRAPEIKRAGLILGAYCFARPGSSNPTEEVDVLVGVVARVGGFKGMLPPILDLEVADGKSPAELRAWTAEWLRFAKERTGRKPILYSYTAFIEEYGLTELAPLCDLWIADYVEGRPNLGGFHEYLFWQYTSSPMDLDRFNGTEEELRAYVEGVEPKIETAAPKAVQHGKGVTVAAGETLARISGRYNIPVAILQRFNGIANANELRVGEWIKLPERYTVKPGDTLARMFPSDWREVARVNAINPDRLSVGQAIYA